jgi:mRNA interferase MazF
MIYEPFSVIVVPFPFTDKVQTKRRPALVLSKAQHQIETGHLTLLMITSAKHSKWASDYQIKQLTSTGLKSPSIIRQKLFTLDIRFVLELKGKLGNKDIKNITNILQEHLDIFI